MGKLVPLFSGASGLNNIDDPLRVKYSMTSGVGDLVEAINVDIDDSGRILRRGGQIQIASGVFHSLFSTEETCLVVKDETTSATLYQVATDFSLTSLRSDLTRAAKLSYAVVGDKIFYSSPYDNGYVQSGASYSWPVNTHVGFETTRQFYPAPLGAHIAYAKGRMWIAQDKVIWVSEPYAVGKFDLARCFFWFGTNIVMMRPVEMGIFISDQETTGFIAFADKFEDFSYRKVMSIPAHEWSDYPKLVDLSRTRFALPGLCAIWSCDDGLCIGTPDGKVIVATKTKLIYPKGSSGATIVYNDIVINNIY